MHSILIVNHRSIIQKNTHLSAPCVAGSLQTDSQSENKHAPTFQPFYPNSYTPTRGASRSRLSCVAHLATVASTVFQLSCVKSYIQTDRACRYTSLHYVVVCNYISLKQYSCVLSTAFYRINEWMRYLHNLSVYWCPAVVVDRSLTHHWTRQYAQPATGDVTRPWWQDTDGWKPAGDLTRGVASLARRTAVVDSPWSSVELACR